MFSGLGSLGGQGTVVWNPATQTEFFRQRSGENVYTEAVDTISDRRPKDSDGKKTRASEIEDVFVPSSSRSSNISRTLQAYLPNGLAVDDYGARGQMSSLGELENGDVEGELSQSEKEMVVELEARDLEVRAHENAHAATGGAYASAPSYSFQVGPNGKRYAVGGEVKIDISPIDGNPEATVRKMQTVIRAARAPVEPSSQDQRVAATATQTMLAAQQEIAEKRANELLSDEGRQVDRSDNATSIDPSRNKKQIIEAHQEHILGGVSQVDVAPHRSTEQQHRSVSRDSRVGTNKGPFSPPYAVSRYQLLSPSYIQQSRSSARPLDVYA